MRERLNAYIDSKLKEIRGEYTDLNSGEVHRAVGGYPGPNHRMPICCSLMRAKMRGNDFILTAPPKGDGASLTIRYFRKNHCGQAVPERGIAQVKIPSVEFEIIWQRIVKFQGESFITKSGLDFTYMISNDNLLPSRADFSLRKENFKKAYEQLPIRAPSGFSADIMGTSYVWSILTDNRIVG